MDSEYLFYDYYRVLIRFYMHKGRRKDSQRIALFNGVSLKLGFDFLGNSPVSIGGRVLEPGTIITEDGTIMVEPLDSLIFNLNTRSFEHKPRRK
jgi:hypothetical protein